MTPPRPGQLSLNTVTVRKRWKLEEIAAGCARHGIRGIAPWHDEVAELGLQRSVRLVKSHDLTVTGYCRGGFFTSENWLEDNRRAIADAHALGALCLVVVAGGLPAGSKDLPSARERIHEGLAAILPEAKAAGVPLAIEPLHPMQTAERSAINTLEQALDLCDRLGDGVGVAVDAYNVWWDPKLQAQIRRAGRRILAYHISDWLVPTADVANDRGMMGDGIIDLPLLRSWLEAAGYQGHHEVEIFSERNWWRRDPDEVLALCKTRHLECS